MRTATIYNFLIEANLIAGIAILLMIPVRIFFRKALGNRVLCFAWLLVAARLLCPLALPNPLINEIASPYNDQPSAVRPIAGQVRVRLSDALHEASWDAINSSMDREDISFDEAMRKPGNAALSRMAGSIANGRAAKAVMRAYLAGAAGVALWFALANARFMRQLKKNRIEPLSGELLGYYQGLCEKYGVRQLPVYFVDPLRSACLVGCLRPFIALPLAASEGQARQMLAHELCHYRAKDHLWTLLTLVCCAVHWFNPLVWAAAAMSRMDRELKCDDHVIQDMDEEARRLYAGTLIQSVTRRAMPGMPMLATGMSMTGRKLKTRVGGILWGGRHVRALAMLFAATASLLLVCAFATAEYQGGQAGREINASAGGTADYNRGKQTLEQALQSPDAIRDEAAAIARAKELLGSSYFQVDVEDSDLQWTVETAEGAWRKINYVVTAKKGGRGSGFLSVWMAVDGSGAETVENGYDPYFQDDYMVDHVYDQENAPSQEEKEKIRQFFLAFEELAEPGESEYFKEIRVSGILTVGEAQYVQLEAVYSDSGSKTVVMEIAPELRLITCYTGNG